MDDMAGSGAPAGAPVRSVAQEDGSLVLITAEVRSDLAKRLDAFSVSDTGQSMPREVALALMIEVGLTYWEHAEREGIEEAQTPPTL